MDTVALLARHMDWFLDHAVWKDAAAGQLWWSMLDLKTGQPPVGERAAGVAKRCYRWIESPLGSNLYWDCPLVVACLALSARTGNARYAQAARDYVRDYLRMAASPSGLIWWGNHYYVDGPTRQAVWFHESSPPRPARGEHDDGRYHETRPLPVPWQVLHDIDPTRALAALQAHTRHLSADASQPRGCFNRHANGAVGLAFQESGGLLALAFASQAALYGDAEAAARASTVLEFSRQAADAGTGLAPVSATGKRWDRRTASSETGLWCGAAFAVADLLTEPQIVTGACGILAEWSARAWQDGLGQFAGRLQLASGQHDRTPQSTIYQPGTFSDPWAPLFPAHDYPMQAAEAALTGWLRSGLDELAVAVARWLDVIERSLPGRQGQGGYAEHYGRAIHLAWRAGRLMARPEWSRLAGRIAEEALSVLACGDLLRTHPWENRVEAVDGAGWLILALLAMEQDDEPELHGLFW